jgi:5-methylcytosine-specific restriction endonuclease McrA
MLVGHAILDI